MRGIRARRLAGVIVGLASLASSGFGAARATSASPVDLVDPMIGTMGAGFTFPGPAMPYGMVQNSPDTEGYFAYTGYQYIDHFIRGFSLVHTESMGTAEGGQIPIMPTTGAIVTDVKRYQSPFEHATEQASVGYYSVLLGSYGITSELTAGMRVGMQRYSFPPTASTGNVLFDVGRQVGGSQIDDAGQTTPGTNNARVTVAGDGTILGSANFDRAADDGYAVHFAARFDRPFVSHGTWSARGATPAAGSSSVTGKGAGAYVTFDTSSNPVVTLKVGISFVSQENARANLESELPGDDFGFDALRARTRDAWARALDVIRVDGTDTGALTSFYTALYHAQHHPNVFQDVNGDYFGYDHAAHQVGASGDPMPAGSTYYANYSFWDTYRAEMPLLMLIAPDRVRDMMRSLAAIVRQGGRIPRWGWMDRYADFMNGEPGIPVVSDAYCRGLVPDEVAGVLYDDMRGLALDPARHRDPDFLSLGYVPYPGSGAASTLEHSIADFALALVADHRGRAEDREALLARAASYRNLLDPATGFVRPRARDGSWAPDPYLPESDDGWREGTGWQYTWLVPHDVRGLFDRMGEMLQSGNDVARRRLDEFFAATPVPYAGPEAQQKMSVYGIVYAGNQYAPANEHDLQAPWLYDWTGEPWKTQRLQRSLQTLYRPTPDGLPGNDDLGTMSAWFVWSALGFYPVTPGSPTYAVGSPMFEHVLIQSGDRAVEIDAPGASAAAMYVQSATVGSAPLARSWFSHDDLLNAGGATFVMGAAPNLEWGAARADAPPSMSANSLGDFRCAA